MEKLFLNTSTFSDETIIGVEFEDKSKGILTPNYSGNFIVIHEDDENTGYSNYNESISKRDWILEHLKPTESAFIFRSVKELCKWIAN